MKVYLSGMITGDSNYRQKFNAMAEELLSYGYVVFNPAVLPDGFDYEDYMDFDLLILSRCEALFLMRDWKNSSGAKREYEEAKRLGLQILTEEDLRIRRTLIQLCNDSKRLIEIEYSDDENQNWTDKMKQISDFVESKVKKFDNHLNEETNLLNFYEALEPELKMFFIEEFISDSDKLIEYDIIDCLNGAEFNEKIKLAQIYSTTADLIELFGKEKVAYDIRWHNVHV